MNTENEMEEVLREAGLETSPEQDKRILAVSGKALSKVGLTRFLRVAAAATVLLSAVVIFWSWQSKPGPEEPVAQPEAVARLDEDAPEKLLNSFLRDEQLLDRTLGVTFNESLYRLENRGGTGGGSGSVGYYHYLPGESGGGGAGGTIRLEASGPMNAPVKILSLRPLSIEGTIQIAEIQRLREELTRRLQSSAGGEEYDLITTNLFRNPRTDPLSTFSVDVDTASYANVRRFLKEGRLPPADAVRIEEMINYFSYSYPQPEGDRPFSVIASLAECPWNPKYRLVRIGVQGRRIAQENVPPRNLVFLLDVSGSMKSEDKLPLVKSAMKLLVGALRPEDRVGIVTYASGTGVALEPTTGDQRFRITSIIDRLTAGGSTNAGSGIQLAYELARKHFEPGAINRVILATDGDFNVGITDRAGLEALIVREREGGIYLTVLGVGTGNIKDSRMEMLADKGNGNYAYLDSILEAQKVLVSEAGATLVTIAKDVKIQVEFNPARVAAYRLVGYENRMLATRDFNDDTKDAGEIGAGHSVSALYEIVPAGIALPLPAIDPLRYQAADPTLKPKENTDFGEEMLFLRLRYKEPTESESRLLEFPLTDPGAVSINQADDDFAFAAAVAIFGKLLRNSPDARGLSFDLVHEIAAGALGSDENGYRKEFLELVKTAGKLER